jgi:hypothetical protein
MRTSASIDITWCCAVIVVTVMTSPAAAFAQDDEPRHVKTAQERIERFDAERDAEEQVRVRQDKSLLRAIQKTKHLRKGSVGNLPHVWPSPECFPGVSWGDSPSLITKESGYSGTAVEPGGITTWQHDRHGNVTFRERLSFDRVRGITRSDIEECAYDDDRGDLRLGKLVYKMSRRTGSRPGPEYRLTYNAWDQIDVQTENFLNLDGTLDYRMFTRYVYDAAGRMLQQVFEVDDPVDGTIDYQSALLIAYDEEGQFTRIVRATTMFPAVTSRRIARASTPARPLQSIGTTTATARRTTGRNGRATTTNRTESYGSCSSTTSTAAAMEAPTASSIPAASSGTSTTRTEISFAVRTRRWAWSATASRSGLRTSAATTPAAG